MQQDAPIPARSLTFVLIPLLSAALLVLMPGLNSGARAAGLPEAQMFPCAALTLVPPGEPPPSPANPYGLKTAKGETHLLLFTLENAQGGSIQVEVAPGQPPPEKSKKTGKKVRMQTEVSREQTPMSWLEVQAYLVRPVPADLPENYLADGLVPLGAAAGMQGYGFKPLKIAVRLRISPEHPQGYFRYDLVVRCGESCACLPLDIQVWNFTLPEDLPIDVFAGEWKTRLDWYAPYGVDKPALHGSVIPASLKLLRQFKVNGIGAFYPVPVEAIANGAPVSDYPEYVALLRHVTDTLKYRRFRIPKLSGAETLGEPGSRFETQAPVYYGLWRDFLSEQGLLGRAHVKVIDEPKPEIYPRVQQAYALVRTICPELITESAGRTPPPELASLIDVWAHHLSGYDEESGEQAACLGMKKWVYANPLHGIDHPPAHQRLIGWLLRQKRFEGYLLWCVNYWPLDPWTNLPGEVDFFRRGTWFYPDPASGLPWPTLRLEALRRGLEDFQYFALLEEAYNQGKVDAAGYYQIMARLEALSADVTTLKPQATWAELEEVRAALGQALHAGALQPVPASRR